MHKNTEMHKSINIRVYADDIVLLAPSREAMQNHIKVIRDNALDIGLSCNLTKIVAMAFTPEDHSWSLGTAFFLF